MTERDTDIEFDFFDEPQTEEATQRRRVIRPGPDAPRAPRRRGPTFRGPQGVTPLLRLILLVVLAIFFVVVLVFVIQGCREENRKNAYKDYVGEVAALARASDEVARRLNDQLTTPGIRQRDLVAQLDGLARAQEQVLRKAEDLTPPGPLREEHEGVVEALQFRVSGINGLAAAFRQTADIRDEARAGAQLAQQAMRLIASDVIWDDLFKDPAKAELERQEVHGVAVPDSNSINPTLASAESMGELWQRLHGAARGGTPPGLHGTGIVSLVVLPSGQQLAPGDETTIEHAEDLAFRASIQNTGESQEVGIQVTLTILRRTGRPVVKTEEIPAINVGQIASVVFEDLPQPDFAVPTTVKLDVRPVQGETRTTNNTAEYPVIFTLAP